MTASPTRPPGWLPDWLRYWGPVALWLAVISTLSGDPFSASNTHRYIDPILLFFFPELTPSGFVLAHSIIRKSAHFVEFFVLGWLTYWALRRGRSPAWRVSWGLQALFFCVAFSLIDELHQALVPSRTSSFLDSAVDSFGGACSVLARYLFVARRSAATSARLTQGPRAGNQAPPRAHTTAQPE